MNLRLRFIWSKYCDQLAKPKEVGHAKFDHGAKCKCVRLKPREWIMLNPNWIMLNWKKIIVEQLNPRKYVDLKQKRFPILLKCFGKQK